MSRPGRSQARSMLISWGVFALGIALTLIFPPILGKQNTPVAILFLGLIMGLLIGLVAAGIVLIYRTHRFINFAQASLGGVGAVFTYQLAIAETTSLPFLLAMPLGLILAGITGVVIELAFIRRFFNAPRLVLTVLSIALTAGFPIAGGFLSTLPIFGNVADRNVLELSGGLPLDMPFSGFEFQLGHLPFPFGFAHLMAIVVSLIALAGLGFFLTRTTSGIAIRASAENTGRASLLGINVKGLSTIVWGLAGVLSGVGVILTAAVTNAWTGVTVGATDVLLVALAAAVVARMRSFPVAVATAVVLQVIKFSVEHHFKDQLELFDAFLFLLILVALFIQRKEMTRSEAEAETTSWEATQELRATPKEMLQIPGIRLWRRVLIGIGVIAILIFPWAASTGPLNQAGFIAITGIAILSLVVLTGWTGQVSLGQFALVGVGALIGGALTAKWGISFWLAIPISVFGTAAFALLIGLPALRIRGLFLAVATYSFAFAVERNLFEKEYFGWLLPERVDRPTLFFLDFEDERSMYYLTLTCFVIAVLLVVTLRRSRPGRVLIGLRENEANIQAFGVSPVQTRLAAFALSGALCGFAGVLLAHHQRAVSADTFPAIESLNTFIFGVIGGLGSVIGALLGAIYFGLSRLLAGNPFLSLIIGPLGLILLLYISPGGLGALLYSLRDSVLRIVAQRRRMVVPSLFADVDPDALARNLAPLAEPMTNAGLAALPLNQRYRWSSVLYAARGKAGDGKRTAPDERSAIGAAAKRFEDVEAGTQAVQSGIDT